MMPAAQATAVLPPTQPTGDRRWWVGVLVTVLILGVLGAGGYFLATALLGEQVKQVKVPSVTGFLQAQAESTLVNAGFVPKVDTKVVGDPAQVGFVQEQNPPANELADEGSTVTITVGKAPKQILVPDVVGMDEADARAKIEAENLTVGTVTPQASTTVPVDQVITQDPRAETPVKLKTPVNLWVSSGPAPVTVPDLTCLSYGAAKALLDKYGLGIEYAGEMPAIPLCPNGNKIVEQHPAANSQANQGAVVQVWVGTEASPSPSPTP
jgi:serine/threonine-protein kinase